MSTESDFQIADGPVTAVLGPTNTGKTHLAIERMCANPSGMIGLPLRLLAREVYDKVVRQKGPNAVALVTGEEKIWPDHARYFVCTVEAMPLDRRVDFLAVDEVQLAVDPDRGHIFTDRILHARGTAETMLLGADTMRATLRRLLPKIEVIRRERFSTLSYVGPRKLTKLPRRSAIVAFSAEEVYAIAELIRRQRGGAAVVMGALSPRTRNAQVALYQSGEVDFLVATDAIGMGLNMDVDHVAFASLAKFDGRRQRRLRADELAQIAGRAGRFRDDGTFGETGDCDALDPETVERIEAHEFEPVGMIEWRSRALDFSTVPALLASLESAPPLPGLQRSRHAIDEETLKRLAETDIIHKGARRTQDVKRLWEICQTPDFRRNTIDEHAKLVLSLAEHLLGARQRIDQTFASEAISRLDRTEGDIDTLQTRLAHIRTWTYVANRPDWIDDCEHWRDVARGVEDRLSDTLHERLMARFIDRRTAALLKGLKREDVVDAVVSEDGDTSIEGHYVGRLIGLSFQQDPRATGLEEKAVRNAAIRALRPEVNRRMTRLAAAGDEAFALGDDGRIKWEAAPVAILVAGSPTLRPLVRLIGGDIGDEGAQAGVKARIEAWLRARVEADLAPLLALENALKGTELSGRARAIAYRVLEGFGVLRTRDLRDLGEVEEEERKALSALGLRFGVHTIYVGALLKSGPARLASILRHYTSPAPVGAPFLPRAGLMSAQSDPDRGEADYAAAGFARVGPRAVRVDMLERLAHKLREARRLSRTSDKAQDFPVDVSMAAVIGAPTEAFEGVLQALGYKRTQKADAEAGTPARWRSETSRPKTPRPERQGSSLGTGTDAAVGDAGTNTSAPQRTSGPKKHRGSGSKRSSERSDRGGGKAPFTPRTAKPGRPLDPSSPFAVLAGLSFGKPQKDGSTE
jgi:ATP-dependent RNA helicase SUPV3L1/SUV3